MVILSIMTTIAFSYKDFTETQKKDCLLEKRGVLTLGRMLMKNVIPDNFVTTFTDLKELGSPLKKPFKSYKPSQVKRDTLSADKMLDSTLSTSSIEDSNIEIHQEPMVILEFFGRQSPDEKITSN